MSSSRPRKHRNAEERSRIVEEVLEAASALPIPPDHPAIVTLAEVLNRYKDPTYEGTLRGTIVVDPGLDVVFDYELPTRRVLRQHVRFGKRNDELTPERTSANGTRIGGSARRRPS